MHRINKQLSTMHQTIITPPNAKETTGVMYSYANFEAAMAAAKERSRTSQVNVIRLDRPTHIYQPGYYLATNALESLALSSGIVEATFCHGKLMCDGQGD